MRLEEITCGMLGDAVRIYIGTAYRGSAQVRPAPELAGRREDPVEVALAAFQDESKGHEAGGRRYTLRLGNREYPFMKLALEESPFEGEFYFAVDTHDQMFASTRDPKLARVMAFSREVKGEIEAAWEGAGIPTARTLAHELERHVREMGHDRQAGRGRRVLVVDDQESIRSTVAQVLERVGYRVDQARDGREALAKADASRHALVLLDVEMPRITGLEVLERLRADPDRRRLPVLLVTAAWSGSPPEGLRFGYLVKPFRLDTLLKFVDMLSSAAPPPV